MSRDSWDTGLRVYSGCGVVNNNYTVRMTQVVENKVRALMSMMGHTEWLCYLIGTVSDKEASITDLYIPEQEVTSVTVDVTETITNKDSIGTIHSHHDMGSFVSGTDVAHLVRNYPICIVVSHKAIIAKVRVKAECGKLVVIDAKVVVTREQDMQKFLEEAKDKIDDGHSHKRKKVAASSSFAGTSVSQIPKFKSSIKDQLEKEAISVGLLEEDDDEDDEEDDGEMEELAL